MRKSPNQRRRSASTSLEHLAPRSRRQRIVWVAATVAVVVGLCGFLDLRGFNYLEQYAYDLRLAVFASRYGSVAEQARKRIVLVSITDQTCEKLTGPPLPRACHAKVLRDLAHAGAQVIAFDLVFDASHPQEDKELADAARAAGKVLWGCVFENSDNSERRLILPNAQLRSASAHVGHLHVPSDPDRPSIDRIEAVLIHGGRPVPAFSLKAALMALGLENEPLRRTARGWRVGRMLVPVDAEGFFSISYLGKPRETFLSLPYEQVYEGAAEDEFYRKTHFFRNKIVVIGDSTTLSSDQHRTPMGDMPGPEIHAHAIATILQRGFVREAPQWVDFLVLCVLTALACLIALRFRIGRAPLAAGGLLCGFVLMNTYLFVDCGRWFHVVAPSTALALTTFGVLAERGLTDEREKRRMLGLLQRYLSPQVADYVVANPDKCYLGGERVEATVLFSDIRGFTSMSEKLEPEEVVARLNEYLQVMTDVAFRHEGTVDKYVGDAIMVLFGIPVPHADHARRAVATAIDMEEALLILQAKWQAEGLSLIDIGIGINTGPMVVGNIGAEQRLDFTVIGDSVNLASRVESLNKEMKTRLLITEATRAAVGDELEVRGPLTATVKGKEENVTVYEVLGWRKDSSLPSHAGTR